MLRLLDARAAIAARGFPPGVTLDVDLLVVDEQRGGNAGSWRLTVAAERGALTRHPDSPQALRLGAGGFAALFAGVPMATLRIAGLAAGGDQAQDAHLDAVFTGPAFMLDYF
jgi:predicted acetyltransferase